MTIDYHREFKKSYRRLTPKLQKQFGQRLSLFVQNPADEQLRTHGLGGEFKGIYSFNLTGDVRVHFRYLCSGHIILLRVGTHAQLYK